MSAGEESRISYRRLGTASLPAFIATIFLLSFASVARTQAAPQKPAAQDAPLKLSSPPDYSKEPFIVEQYVTRMQFENDGTGLRELLVKIRVQSDAGVQQLGELTFGYNAANERLEMAYVRVHKADGSVIAATPEALKDLTAPIAREAPMYTDTHEVHVTVPALRPGETLDYDIRTHLEKPLAPGQFWFEHNFLEGAIVLDEQLEINIPKGRAVKLKTQPGLDPSITEVGDRKIYRWSRALRELPSEDEQKKANAKKSPKPPSVQLTTFANWEEVARWYAGLERERIIPSPEIRVKALELVAGQATGSGKIQALYDYVAKNIRYVSLSFGVGRYQPHAAGDVFTNQYGDCKDKHTLLAAMLSAAGIPSDAVLIGFSRDLDPDLPSPAQFDHVITAVPAGDTLLWMDTTAEVAPFRLLIARLRKKQALLVPPDGAGRLVETPADPPFLASQRVEVEGSVTELGKLNARVRYTMRGDVELALRVAFRRTPPAQWKQIAQTMAIYDGFRGEVSDVKTSDPAETHEPFWMEFHLAQPNFLDWSSRKSKLALPLPAIGLPSANEDATDPIELGSPLDVTMRLQLTLPAKLATQTPIAMALARDYAEYRSSYKLDGDVISAERTLRFKTRELPASRAGDYVAFTRAVEADEGQTLSLELTTAGTPSIPVGAKAAELEEAGEAALQGRNFKAAAELFQRVVEFEPKHKSAWMNLGRARYLMNQLDAAADAFRKQIELNPYDATAYDALGLVFLQEQKYDDAAAQFRKQLEVNPLDFVAHASLGNVYLQQRKFAEAAPELDKALALQSGNAQLEVSLGYAYLNTGQTEKAMEAFNNAVEHSPTPEIWNDVAYRLAERDMELDRAQQYAESAVSAAAAASRNADLAHLTLADLARTASLAAYWDTLGWIHFQRGNLDLAEKYVRASWELSQHGEVGDHLGQIYEKQGKKQEAIRTYALATGASRRVPETRGRLLALAGSESKVATLSASAGADLSAVRTLGLGKFGMGKSDGEFYVLLSPGPKVEAIKFIKGDEKLRPLMDRLHSLKYPAPFPDDTPAKVIRRGILSCSSASGECIFILMLPEDVHAVD
jgi:tetratricopeptide (TPR) repeat protein/transglutaminase-like putative cysteine protease